ncbi:MAG: hypothetical protein ACE37H_01700 [Phycisphaeraceae bacterium]
MTNTNSKQKRFGFRLAAALLVLLGSGVGAYADERAPLHTPVTRDQLFEPAKDVRAVVKHQAGGLSVTQGDDDRWAIAGELTANAGTIRFAPTSGAWDFSDHSLFRVQLTNTGPGTVWVEARLDNGGALDWANSSVSQNYLLPGETGFVTVGYPRPWEQDDSPEAFEPAASKPNGWRSHWKRFNPADVKACRLVVRSSHPTIKLTDVRLCLAWPYGMEHNRTLNALPHIDRYGQAIPFDWPTKIKSDNDLVRQREEEADKLANDKGPAEFNRFGGYANGPQRDATGYFRTEKIDGKWWLIDPEGKLFWSHGVCTVANRAITNLGPGRRPLFQYIPKPGTPDHTIGMSKRNDTYFFDFLRLNTARKYGEGWEDKARDVTHRRLRAWGMNTLGAWSEDALMNDRKTPYTDILHVWHGPKDIDKTADPFEEGFEARYREAIAKRAELRGRDPWMVGVFVDNEIHWHDDMIEKVLALGDEQPAYRAFVNTLQNKHGSIDALNKAWGINAAGWDALVPGKTDAWRADREALYAQMAERYYRVVKQAMDELLPNHLYLGSRVHTAPPVVLRAMANDVDVYSANDYGPLAGRGGLPADADVPVMISEYHFGTIDRGVTGMSLCPVDGQTARERSFAAYVAAGLIHPNVVGAHWFAYSDHSTVGRPNENYQIGMIDITDRPYDGFVAMSRAIGERMYRIRLDTDAQLLDEVGKLIKRAGEQ